MLRAWETQKSAISLLQLTRSWTFSNLWKYSNHLSRISHLRKDSLKCGLVKAASKGRSLKSWIPCKTVLKGIKAKSYSIPFQLSLKGQRRSTKRDSDKCSKSYLKYQTFLGLSNQCTLWSQLSVTYYGSTGTHPHISPRMKSTPNAKESSKR